LLRQALAPVEPSDELKVRVERRLTTIVELAADELDAWELSAMRDPRKWPTIARPVVAGAVGGVAAVGLVLVRTQRKRHKRREAASDPLDLAERTIRDLAHEAGKLIEEAGRRIR
jgi:hypothetical protein